jgi:hypothetical protein
MPVVSQNSDRIEVVQAYNQGKEDAAAIIEAAQIFHSWGDASIDGLEVRRRLADAVRAAERS